MSPIAQANDLDLMRQALRLAMLGRGAVEPNPLVACILVKEGQILAQAYHQRFGGLHAEAAALIAARHTAAGATAYVTLEPCCHTEKKTPPCVPKLIAAHLGRIVVGCLDPNPMVNGKGVAQLRDAGIETDVGVLEPECRQLNAAFFKRMQQRRPYVTLKWAQTADGKAAAANGKRLVISNHKSLAVLHALRSRCDAVLVGIETALADDPLLTARGVTSSRPLLRIILDSELRLPLISQLVRTHADGPVLVYCTQTAYDQSPDAVAALRARGVEPMPIAADPQPAPDGSTNLCLTAVLDDLGARSITHLLVEPGPTLAASFLRSNLADRVWVFRSPKHLDASDAPDAPGVTYTTVGQATLDGDQLIEYLNPTSPAYFAPAQSADFLRAI